MPKVSMQKLRVEYANYVGSCRKCGGFVMTFEEFVEVFGDKNGDTVFCAMDTSRKGKVLK